MDEKYESVILLQREFDPFPVLLEVGLAKDSGKGGRQVGHCVLALHILQAS